MGIQRERQVRLHLQAEGRKKSEMGFISQDVSHNEENREGKRVREKKTSHIKMRNEELEKITQ